MRMQGCLFFAGDHAVRLYNRGSVIESGYYCFERSLMKDPQGRNLWEYPGA